MARHKVIFREVSVKKAHILRNVLGYIIVIFCIVTINFLLIRFMPGDPVMHIIGEDEYLRLELSEPQVIEEVRKEYELNKPTHIQYINYLKRMIKFDFGNSYRTKTPVLETVLFRMRWTLILAVPAIVISSLLGAWLGLISGWRKGGKVDMILSPIMLTVSTIPSNCIAIICLLIFSFNLGLFPIGGITSGGLEGTRKVIDIVWHTILPMSVLILYKTPSFFMLMKSIVQSIRGEEYIAVAESKGFTSSQVLRRHILKNTLCSYATSVCMHFGSIMAGSMIVEIVFSWKGMGTLINQSVNTKDFPVLQACFLIIGITTVFFNFIADLLNVVIDPRVKEGVYNGE